MPQSKKETAPSFATGMLAYARSVQITEGLFYATASPSPDTKTPIAVHEKGVRGQSSQDKAEKPGKSNPQSVEFAVIPQDHDGVALSFSARFSPMSLAPHACDSTEVGDNYRQLVEQYRCAGGFHVIAGLYAWNIANARFAWRNRFQSDEMGVVVQFDSTTLRFDPLALGLDNPPDGSIADGLAEALVEGTREEVAALIEGIAEGLSNPEGKAFAVNVTWWARMEPGQEIFPSQEYVRQVKADDDLSRVLAKLPTHRGDRTVMQASMHSQKIGAALRHIDIWHDSDTHPSAIAVNPYGGVQQTSAVLRDPGTKRSFYDLRSRPEELLRAVKSANTTEEITGDTHFFVANLIRGGVFGRKTP